MYTSLKLIQLLYSIQFLLKQKKSHEKSVTIPKKDVFLLIVGSWGSFGLVILDELDG